MKRLLRWLGVMSSAAVLSASPAAAEEPGWFQGVRSKLTDIWQTGSSDILVPLHTHHLRSAYDSSKIDSYQENPYGLGYGRSKLDGDGDLQGVYAMTFQDSDHKPSYMAGYMFQKFWRPAADWRVGGGFTAFVMARSDTWHYTPFPAALPFGSIGYKRLAIEATYVPGGNGYGNVIFIWSRFHLD